MEASSNFFPSSVAPVPPRDAAQRPVAVQYCATFLKPEMFHIYRQITALENWRPHIICQKREGGGRFPFDEAALTVLPKPRTHSLRRIWVKQIRHRPVMIYESEARRIAEEIERVGGEVLHVYFGNIAVHTLPLLRHSPVPVVVSFHGADAGVDMDWPAYRVAIEETFRVATLVLARSEALGQRLLEVGCPPEKLRIHRTGIPLENFHFAPRSFPWDGAWRLFQACRLIPKKGLHTALRAFATFSLAHPGSTFTIAGEGPLLEELQALASELGVAEVVRFTGFLKPEALAKQLAAAHVFVHPSEIGPDGNQEGVPNSMLEAMATGMPVVATRHGGIPEAVEEGVSGYLVAERDAEALAEALERITADPARYRRMGAAAARAVAEGFESHSQARTLERFYAEAAGMGALAAV
ncbi:MAG: glycosyltransferase [Chthoniobacteraceae bacterium]